jgi:hypothetical protein
MTEDGASTREAFGALFLVNIGVIVPVGLVAWIFRGKIDSFTGVSEAWLLLTVLFVGVAWFQTTVHVLQATDRFGSATWFQAGRDTVRVVLQITLVVLVELGITGMVTGIVGCGRTTLSKLALKAPDSSKAKAGRSGSSGLCATSRLRSRPFTSRLPAGLPPTFRGRDLSF